MNEQPTQYRSATAHVPRSALDAKLAELPNGRGLSPVAADDRPAAVRLLEAVETSLGATDRNLTLTRELAGRLLGDPDQLAKVEHETFGDFLGEPAPQNEGVLPRAERAVRLVTQLQNRTHFVLSLIERQL